MKRSILHDRVKQKLDEFENIGNIQPSSDWNEKLMMRIGAEKQYSASRISATKLALAVLIIILVNLGFILNTFSDSSMKEKHRSSELQAISNELLINSNFLIQ